MFDWAAVSFSLQASPGINGFDFGFGGKDRPPTGGGIYPPLKILKILNNTAKKAKNRAVVARYRAVVARFTL